ncbi:MAG: sugar phosphate isomerase/epimerase [Armatimonadota bacterium]|nr:sugar phosphate isomerase/epimerase [Armatimonadota bacterium]
MYRCLSPGAAGISATLEEALALARSNGFEGLEVNMGDVEQRARNSSMEAVQKLFFDAQVKPGGWGLPVNLHAPEEKFEEDLKALRPLAKAAQGLGCPRTSTWIMSASDTLPFEENFRWHQERLGKVASVLGEYGCRLGLEFLGPQTIWRSKTHPFIHTMTGMLELAAACGPNTGLLLDCWHWYTSGSTVEELKGLKPEQVVYVHVNDAPRGVKLEDHVDNVRGLPGETGVIDIGGFLRTLREIGYDGPVTAEPFSPTLPQMNAAEAARTIGDSMKLIWKELD